MDTCLNCEKPKHEITHRPLIFHFSIYDLPENYDFPVNLNQSFKQSSYAHPR